jgi:hypothetical protein
MGVGFAARARNVSVFQNGQTGFGIYPISTSIGTEAPFTWIKQPGREANQSTLSIVARFRICGTLPPLLHVLHCVVFN